MRRTRWVVCFAISFSIEGTKLRSGRAPLDPQQLLHRSLDPQPDRAPIHVAGVHQLTSQVASARTPPVSTVLLSEIDAIRRALEPAEKVAAKGR